jgi:hydrogenase maturation protease
MAVVRVIGCGNADAGDDAVGILAVRAAGDALRALPGVEVVDEAAPMAVVHLLEGADAAVVVDAIRTPGGGRSPGTVIRAEAGPEGLPAEIRSSLSSHGLGVAEAVGLAVALGPAPHVVVLGVEAGQAEPGGGLSEAVREAMPRLVELLLTEAGALVEGVWRATRAEAERSPGGGSTGPTRGDPSPPP